MLILVYVLPSLYLLFSFISLDFFFLRYYKFLLFHTPQLFYLVWFVQKHFIFLFIREKENVLLIPWLCHFCIGPLSRQYLSLELSYLPISDSWLWIATLGRFFLNMFELHQLTIVTISRRLVFLCLWFFLLIFCVFWRRKITSENILAFSIFCSILKYHWQVRITIFA